MSDHGWRDPWTLLNVAYLYFVQAETGGPIKIGKSRDPTRRLAGIQSGHWQPLTLTRVVAVYDSAVDQMEQNMHQHFEYARIRGEWYNPVPELVKLARAKC